MNVRSGCVIQ